MRKINILQLIGSFTNGGAERVVVNLANGLSEDLFQVILSARKDGPVSRGLKNKDNLYVIEKRTVIDIMHLTKLINLVRKHKIDIIHSHMFGTNLYGFMAAKLTGARIIQTIHGRDCLDAKQRVLAYRFMAKFTDKIVTVSESLEAEISRTANIAAKKICTIHNGIDVGKYSARNSGTAARKKLGLPLVCPVIGAVGNIKQVKAYDIFIKAAAKVREEYPEATFVIVGETPEKHARERQNLHDLINSLGLQEHVRFLGYREDISQILSLFDVYVLPSRSEGLSLALLEAMAARRAIVATAVGGNPLIIKEGVSGMLVPAEEPSVLAERIKELLKNRQLRHRLGRNAKRLVMDKFSISQMVQKYENTYQEVLAKF